MTNNIDTFTLSLLANEAGYDPIADRLRATIRATIEAVFEAELDAFVARCRYDRGTNTPTGYSNGHRARPLIGTFGTETISVLRARAVDESGKTTQWRSKALPRSPRLTRMAEALMASVYRAGIPTRRLQRALYGRFEGGRQGRGQPCLAQG